MTLEEVLALCRAELEREQGDAPETYKSGWRGGRRELAREILGETDDAPPENEQDDDEDDPLEMNMECEHGCGVTLHRDSIDHAEERWRCSECHQITWVPGPPEIPEGPRVMIVELPEGHKDHAGYPWRDGDSVLFLGEILNMPGGHCVVVSKDGRVDWAFHTDNFREPTEDEL